MSCSSFFPSVDTSSLGRPRLGLSFNASKDPLITADPQPLKSLLFDQLQLLYLVVDQVVCLIWTYHPSWNVFLTRFSGLRLPLDFRDSALLDFSDFFEPLDLAWDGSGDFSLSWETSFRSSSTCVGDSVLSGGLDCSSALPIINERFQLYSCPLFDGTG